MTFQLKVRAEGGIYIRAFFTCHFLFFDDTDYAYLSPGKLAGKRSEVFIFIFTVLSADLPVLSESRRSLAAVSLFSVGRGGVAADAIADTRGEGDDTDTDTPEEDSRCGAGTKSLSLVPIVGPGLDLLALTVSVRGKVS